ncbi:mechanosensitive ion channel [Flavobacterium sp. Sd200]|uniref:mechanosensitive ion channel domain-containing protein n=1 Tax=Flavobacterium sp. Sd200 TaxID=2692211 RepID=UPI00136A6F1D|nr:mechanosensitive ion channel domain-containing protein [Flavobacterium sp. Sd200]MXN93166.1 mechanosensitive ion channel [Flavobacterium sp. Sd200]
MTKKDSHRHFFCLATIIVLWCLPLNLHAQLLPGVDTESTEKAPVVPEDSLGRRTPRGTVEGFFKAVADENYIRASRYLQLKRAYRKTKQRERIVKNFKLLLDKGGNITAYSFISNKNTGYADDDLPTATDKVGTVTINGETINLLLENNEPDDTPAVWLFSLETVNAIAAVNTDDITLLDNILPDYFKSRTLWGVPLGHWLAVVVFILVSYLLAWIIIYALSFIVLSIWKKLKEQSKTYNVINILDLPLRLYLAVWFFVAISQQAGLSIIVRQRFSSLTVTIGIVAFLILLWRLSDTVSNYVGDKMTLRKRISAISVILFLRRSAKVAIVIFGTIAILGAIGVDVTTGLAALGIGGIALALGAQKTMENFVGSVTLIADQPIRVGDFCRIGDIKGTVESIGMRSTRLRTSARTVVTIPNGDLSASRIENFAHRDRYLFNHTFEFRMETSPDQIRYLLVEFRSLLYAHPCINPDPAKVRFVGFTDSAIKIEFFAYIEAISLDASQEIQEDLLLHIMDITTAAGTDFAYPSQTLYFAKDNGLSNEKVQQTTETVRQWKEANDMQLPSFSDERIENLKGTVPYPPEGSVLKKNGEEEKE